MPMMFADRTATPANTTSPARESDGERGNENDHQIDPADLQTGAEGQYDKKRHPPWPNAGFRLRCALHSPPGTDARVNREHAKTMGETVGAVNKREREQE